MNKIILILIAPTIASILVLINRLADGLTPQEWAGIVISVGTAINIILTAMQAWKRGKPEVKRIEAETDTEIVEAAHSNIEMAQINSNMLLQRIEDLKKDLDAEKKARQEDRVYFNRRVKEIDREARDYRLWAARLAKQVIEAGKVPVPFISNLNDTDPLITAISREQEQLILAKQARVDEIKKQKQETKE